MHASALVLERLAEIRCACFDKTGTLTTGIPTASSFHVAANADPRQVLELAHLLASGSNHSLSKAIVAYTGEHADITSGAEGSLVTTWVTYVPCFLWIFLGAPYIEYLRGNRDRVEQVICSIPSLRITHAEATYLSWIDARALAKFNVVEVLEQAGVGVYDGAQFGAPGFIRLNFACPRSVLNQALERLAGVLGRLK